MKRSVIILFTLLLSSCLFSQNTAIIGTFPLLSNESEPVSTTSLLGQLNWESLKKYNNQGHYVEESNDSLTTTYEYNKQGRSAFFKLRSFKGSVMEFESQFSTNQESKSSFFDKKVWISYAHARLPYLPGEYKLTKDEQADILKAWYQLLGVDTRDEYGWHCEYGARGKPTQRRLAVVKLIKAKRWDLLKKLLNYSNLQSRLYAADALIYLDHETKERIELMKEWITEKEKILDELKKQPGRDKEKIDFIKIEIGGYKDGINFYEKKLLTDAEWKAIYEIRDSNKEVKICMNGTGSYKIYTGNTSEILSGENIREIPRLYDVFKEMGLL